MYRSWILCGLLALTIFAQAANPQSTSSYDLSVSADEVDLLFHASDAQGLPVNDLRLEELTLRDNGKPPARILTFEPLQNLPIRAGILLDTSASMEQHLGGNRSIAIKYAQRLLHTTTDLAFVMNFNYVSEIAQPWTNSTAALTAGIRKFAPVRQGSMGGTAIFTAIYQACLNQFSHVDHAASGNFILLFSDGEDNASQADSRQAIDICQRAHTSIYAFHEESALPSGPKALADLAAQTGGRVFYGDGSDTAIDNDLRTIEADLRDQYRLVYKPAEFKHDGSYHAIELQGPERVNSITARAGYYAPGQPPGQRPGQRPAH